MANSARDVLDLVKEDEFGRINLFDNADSDKDAKHYADFGLTGSRYAQSVVLEMQNLLGAKVEEYHGTINSADFLPALGMLISFP